MKSIANIVVTLFRLGVIEYQVYSLAITISGREECLACVRDPQRIAGMQGLQDIARAEVRRLERIAERLSDRIANAMQRPATGFFSDFQPRR